MYKKKSSFVAKIRCLSGYLPELCKCELRSPDFSLAAKTVGTDKLEPEKKKKEEKLARS